MSNRELASYCTENAVLSKYIFSCDEYNIKQRVVYLTTEFAGITLVPLSVFSFTGNVIMLAMLWIGSNRPSRLRLWVTVQCICDIVFIYLMGIVRYLYSYAAPWWNFQGTNEAQENQFKCKMFQLFINLSITLHINLGMFAMITEAKQQPATDLLRNENFHSTYAWISVTFLISFIQVIPTWFIAGLWQLSGVFVCSGDPQWPSLYHRFYFSHTLFYCDGLIQSLVIFSMIFILKRKLQAMQDSLAIIGSHATKRNLIGKMLSNLKSKLEIARVDMRILLISCLIDGSARLVQSLWLIFASVKLYAPIFELDFVEDAGLVLQHLGTVTLRLAWFMFGIWLSTFRPVWWYQCSPEIRDNCLRFFKCCTNQEVCLRWCKRKSRRRKCASLIFIKEKKQISELSEVTEALERFEKQHSAKWKGIRSPYKQSEDSNTLDLRKLIEFHKRSVVVPRTLD